MLHMPSTKEKVISSQVDKKLLLVYRFRIRSRQSRAITHLRGRVVIADRARMGDCSENGAIHGMAVRGAANAERAAQCARLLGRQLRRILTLVGLEVAGETVLPDSYVFGPNGGSRPFDQAESGVRYEALLSYSRNEPLYTQVL